DARAFAASVLFQLDAAASPIERTEPGNDPRRDSRQGPDPMATPIAATTTPRAARVEAGSVRDVVLLAYPIVLTQISHTVMQLVDSIFVGRLGAAELGALGFAGIWLWTVFSLFNGALTGVQTFVSQSHGAGEPRACGPWVWQALYGVVPPMA